jgi:hypothetical protein
MGFGAVPWRGSRLRNDDGGETGTGCVDMGCVGSGPALWASAGAETPAQNRTIALDTAPAERQPPPSDNRNKYFLSYSEPRAPLTSVYGVGVMPEADDGHDRREGGAMIFNNNLFWRRLIRLTLRV